MLSVVHPIQVVSRLTGLSPHVIRVWEKRYGAVRPRRTGTNRRQYSDAEVERLRLLARATDAGHKIGMIARLELPALADLVQRITSDEDGGGGASRDDSDDGIRGRGGPDRRGPGSDAAGWAGTLGRSRHEGGEAGGLVAVGDGVVAPETAARLVRESLEAVRRLDVSGLVRGLERGAACFGRNGVLQRLVCPLSHTIGDLWQSGELTAAHEHFASVQIREFLTRHSRPFATEDGAPRVVVATPPGQLHELGALMVSAVAAHHGWLPLYLGTALPAAELAGAATQNGARAVCLSVVYPADDPQLPEELAELRRLLPAEVRILVGGRGASGYDTVLRSIGALTPRNLDELAGRLREIRAGVQAG